MLTRSMTLLWRATATASPRWSGGLTREQLTGIGWEAQRHRDGEGQAEERASGSRGGDRAGARRAGV